MDLRIISFLSPQENILFDEVLFRQAESGLSGEMLRFWESERPFIVLGKTSKMPQEVICDNISRDSIPVIRRSSAGGVVVQGKGCLNFALVLSKKTLALRTIPSSYEFILGKIIQSLQSLGVQAQFHPPCDLALVDSKRKFSGNAQRRGKNFILHHGTILYNFDISLAEKYLLLPLKAPTYRKNRSHREFMTNICVDPKKIISAVSQVFKVTRENNQICDFERGQLLDLSKVQKEFAG